MRTKFPDKKRALSVIAASEKEMKYTLNLPVSEESAFNIIRNIYECFRMLGDALLISRGFASEDHAEQVTELQSIAEAEDAISITKACYYQLLESIKKEIKMKVIRKFSHQ